MVGVEIPGVSFGLLSSWFRRLLYRLTLLASLALISLVIFSPWVENKVSSRLVSVFAHDRTLRRTSVASALGLLVSACVFFRIPGAPRRVPPKSPQAPPPPNMAGA